MENVTAVIPFFNGHRYIERLLKSLPEDLPVIIVDDGLAAVGGGSKGVGWRGQCAGA